MKKILTLHSDAFLWCNEKEGLLYDSKKCRSFKFAMSPSIARVCRELLDYDRLYSISYDEDSSDTSLKEFVRRIVTMGAGTIHDESSRVISLPPLLNLQHSIMMQERREFEFQDHSLPNLIGLTIYTGGICQENNYFLQTQYPVSSSEIIMPVQDIIGIIDKLNSQYLSDISIVFSEISSFPSLQELFSFFEAIGKKVKILFRAEEASRQINDTLATYEAVQPHILFSPERLSSELPDIGSIPDKGTLVFLVASENDYMTAENLSEGLQNIKYVPVYNGCNDKFFMDNVFLREEDILASHLSRRQVFMHQVLNTEFFGRLSVMPDGKVYSDLTSPALGTVSDSVYDLILKEMEENHSWRRIRNRGQCAGCLYRYLCPSPSIYEKLMDITAVRRNFTIK